MAISAPSKLYRNHPLSVSLPSGIAPATQNQCDRLASPLFTMP
ncbi:hypothetical protein [Calothrix sp. PCC 7507]|nr:hypothetical protein [Calothrix sp. PCC 7507]